MEEEGFTLVSTQLRAADDCPPSLWHEATIAAAGPLTLAKTFFAFLSFCFALATSLSIALSDIHDSHTAMVQSPMGMR